MFVFVQTNIIVFIETNITSQMWPSGGKALFNVHRCVHITGHICTTAENNSDNLPSYPPESHHCSGVVYWHLWAENVQKSKAVKLPVQLAEWQHSAMCYDHRQPPQHKGCRRLQEFQTPVFPASAASVWRLLGDSMATTDQRQPIAVQRCRSPLTTVAGAAAALTGEDHHACIWMQRQWIRPLWWYHSKHLL